jgi:hypothetical protein
MPTLNTPQVVVSSMREAQELLRKAAKARQSSGTNANERSSRSHAVITVRASLGLNRATCSEHTPGFGGWRGCMSGLTISPAYFLQPQSYTTVQPP